MRTYTKEDVRLVHAFISDHPEVCASVCESVIEGRRKSEALRVAAEEAMTSWEAKLAADPGLRAYARRLTAPHG